MLHIHQFKQFRPKMKFLTLSSNTPSLKVVRGSDVSLRCDFPLLNESSTLHWEKDGEQISNATLMYNNSAYIILHTVDERSEETYYSTYNSQALMFHISPVNFNYRGTYRWITETGIYTTIILYTIRVSVEPPDGVLRNQSVVLTCELSEVTGSVILVWLRMEGNRGVLVKQQIMTEKNKKLQLTVNLSSYETDPMNWQCAVFTENTLRALAPITISLTSTTTNAPSMSTETSTVTNQVIIFEPLICSIFTLNKINTHKTYNLNVL
ncbi:uncharacterized protein LOC107733623 [Sinocyclocheilus rhinocerous]|uniref:uncharacterized protein LOC107733623 n=1 Tax=Sinocyclocheilus rhinocerous TaxID=307959 RepID=UPI0007B9D8D4|nr:PREDICTED: uncharacterized protein LOC107733623 [Sinocyclocheilus rhinocerous]